MSEEKHFGRTNEEWYEEGRDLARNEPTYQHYPMMRAIRDAVRPHLQTGEMLIYRDAFRWKDDANNHVLSNHYEMFELRQLASDFNYEIVHDFHHVAVVRKKGLFNAK